MNFGIRPALIALTVGACLGATAARAGDDGSAPLWEGIGSIFGPLVGFGSEEKPAIDYREHGKIVVPKSLDLPSPGGAAAATAGGAWPVNQEIQRKAAAKESTRKKLETTGDVRMKYTHAFPANTPVTVRASDQVDSAAAAQVGGGAAQSSSMLGNLNPLGWVGMGKSAATLGPEPDREWLTDPPKGYRAPVGPTPAKPATAGQASN